MLDNKFIFTLIGLLVAIFAICKMDVGNTQPVVENFWGGIQLTQRAVPGAVNLRTGQESALNTVVLNDQTMGSGKFIQVPSYQAMLSPRFSNVDYGAFIKYNLPAKDNMAVPCDPLTFGDMAKENFVPGQTSASQIPRMTQNRENYCGDDGGGSCGSPASCGKGGYGFGHKLGGGVEVPAGYTNGNFQDVRDSLPAFESMGSDLPVGTMATMDGAGNQEQFVTFNRLMYSNRPASRKFGQGDFIRGDVMITPNCTGWFSVYPNIATDINPGAMGVLSGVGGGGESYNNLMDLLVKSTGGASTTFGGVDLATGSQQQVMMNAQSAMKVSAGLGDVQVTAFP